MIAAKSLIYFSPDGGWPKIGSVIHDRVEFGKSLFLSLSYRDNLVNILLLKLREEWVADLFIWLEISFPSNEDPEPEFNEFHEVSDRESLSRLRDLLVSGLANKGTYEAQEAIRKITHEFPDKKWIFDYLHTSEENLRRTSWEPMLPHTILDLLLNSEHLSKIQRKKVMNNIRFVVEVIIGILLLVLPSLITPEGNSWYKFLVDRQTPLLLILIFAIILDRFLSTKNQS